MNASASAREEERMGRLSAGEFVCLAAILAAALALRVSGISWGLPPSTPEMAASGIRSSYAFDEDNALQSLTRTNPAALDFDPKLYHWGTLHLQLLLFTLEGAQAAGVFSEAWRTAFQQMSPGDFERVYLVGRSLSAAIDLATVFLVFLIAREVWSRAAGFWASAFVAVAPGHVLHAHQIRVDVSAAALIALTALLAVRSLRAHRRRDWFFLGAAAGLAIAAKYSSVLVAAALVLGALWPPRFQWLRARWAIAGCAAGFLAGEPFILTNTMEVARQIGRLIWLSRQIPESFLIPKYVLLAQHLSDLARFSLGLVTTGLAVWGFVVLMRRRRAAGTILLAAALAGVAGFLPQNFPLLRYQLLILPLCAVSAGAAAASLPLFWRWALGTPAVVTALAASLAQIHYMRLPHPVNQALAAVQRQAPRGAMVARIMPEVPPLDPAVYPMGPNPFLDDLTKNPPPWAVTADLPIGEYPARNRRLLAKEYEQVAVFKSPRIFSWATLGEQGSPHDWKYTHPTLVLYRRQE